MTCRDNKRYVAFCRATGRDIDEPGLGWGRAFTAWMTARQREAGESDGVKWSTEGRYPRIFDHALFTTFVQRRAEELLDEAREA